MFNTSNFIGLNFMSAAEGLRAGCLGPLAPSPGASAPDGLAAAAPRGGEALLVCDSVW